MAEEDDLADALGARVLDLARVWSGLAFDFCLTLDGFPPDKLTMRWGERRFEDHGEAHHKLYRLTVRLVTEGRRWASAGEAPLGFDPTPFQDFYALASACLPPGADPGEDVARLRNRLYCLLNLADAERDRIGAAVEGHEHISPTPGRPDWTADVEPIPVKSRRHAMRALKWSDGSDPKFDKYINEGIIYFEGEQPNHRLWHRDPREHEAARKRAPSVRPRKNR